MKTLYESILDKDFDVVDVASSPLAKKIVKWLGTDLEEDFRGRKDIVFKTPNRFTQKIKKEIEGRCKEITFEDAQAKTYWVEIVKSNPDYPYKDSESNADREHFYWLEIKGKGQSFSFMIQAKTLQVCYGVVRSSSNKVNTPYACDQYDIYRCRFYEIPDDIFTTLKFLTNEIS